MSAGVSIELDILRGRADAAEQAYDALLEALKDAAEKCVACEGKGTLVHFDCSKRRARGKPVFRIILTCPHCAPMRALIAAAERGLPND